MKLHELEEHLRLGGLVRRRCWEPKEQGLRLAEYWSLRVESLFADDWEPEFPPGATVTVLSVYPEGAVTWPHGTYGVPQGKSRNEE